MKSRLTISSQSVILVTPDFFTLLIATPVISTVNDLAGQLVLFQGNGLGISAPLDRTEDYD